MSKAAAAAGGASSESVSTGSRLKVSPPVGLLRCVFLSPMASTVFGERAARGARRPGRRSDLRGGRVAQREADDEDCSDDSRHFRRMTRGGRANDAWQCGDANRYNNRNPHSSGHPPRGPSNHLVLDFGSQYTQLIARRLRELSVYSRDLAVRHAARDDARAQARSASSSRAARRACRTRARRSATRRCSTLGMPVLGICYGMQLMADTLGGRVAPAPQREFGHAAGAPWRRRRRARCSRDVPGRAPRVGEPRRLRRAPRRRASRSSRPARTRRSRRWRTRRAASTRCCSTPKSSHTERGLEILRNFAYGVCGCTGDWTMASFVEEATARIRAQVGDGRVVCALSGGVDSTVAALLIHRAIGDQLTCIFVDNGVLRLDEAAQIRKRFERLQLPLVFVDASDAVPRPARRRHRSRAEAQDHRRDVHRRVRGRGGQARAGRLPRRRARSIPTSSSRSSIVGQSVVIKSHHNVGGLPERMRMQAGRAAARAVQGRSARGRPRARARRGVRRPPAVPGPGPRGPHPRRGHARRGSTCCAAPTRSSPRKCGAPGWYARLWQSFAVLLPVQSVGVMGDERTYEYTVAIRAVESRDGMTADWARLPHDLLGAHLVAHRQRSARHQPRRLRHQLEAAVDDRMGMSSGPAIRDVGSWDLRIRFDDHG